MTGDNATERVQRELKRGNVGMAIAEMEVYLAAWPQAQTAERLHELKEQYELMTGYWRQGADDPQQQDMYQQLLQRMYVLYANVAVTRRLRASSFLKGLHDGVRRTARDWSVAAIRRELENFVSEAAMLELEPEHQRAEKSRALYREHQQQMNALFGYVLTSRMWSEGVGRDFTDMLLSPTVDSNVGRHAVADEPVRHGEVSPADGCLSQVAGRGGTPAGPGGLGVRYRRRVSGYLSRGTHYHRRFAEV